MHKLERLAYKTNSSQPFLIPLSRVKCRPGFIFYFIFQFFLALIGYFAVLCEQSVCDGAFGFVCLSCGCRFAVAVSNCRLEKKNSIKAPKSAIDLHLYERVDCGLPMAGLLSLAFAGTGTCFTYIALRFRSCVCG